MFCFYVVLLLLLLLLDDDGFLLCGQKCATLQMRSEQMMRFVAAAAADALQAQAVQKGAFFSVCSGMPAGEAQESALKTCRTGFTFAEFFISLTELALLRVNMVITFPCEYSRSEEGWVVESIERHPLICSQSGSRMFMVGSCH